MNCRVSSAIDVCTGGPKSGNAVRSFILLFSGVSPSHCSAKVNTRSMNAGRGVLSGLNINPRAAASSCSGVDSLLVAASCIRLSSGGAPVNVNASALAISYGVS